MSACIHMKTASPRSMAGLLRGLMLLFALVPVMGANFDVSAENTRAEVSAMPVHRSAFMSNYIAFQEALEL